MKMKSPYLTRSDRLGDVVAAIQVMGTYKFYKLDFSGWADRITGEASQGTHWKEVFKDHPEFFRLDSKKEKASLVWRRQFSKRFNVDDNKEISRDEFYSLPPEKQERISRNPLPSEAVQSLIKTAIDLHSGALQHQQDKRWAVVLAISSIGGLLGALLGSLI